MSSALAGKEVNLPASVFQARQTLTLPAFAHPQPTPPDEITKKIDALINGKYAVVLAGFSGLGYAQPKELEQKIRELLDDALSRHPQGIVMVAGGTKEGIGVAYELLAREASYAQVKSIGIVSQVVQTQSPASISEHCAHNMVFVPDENETWEVLNAAGTHSYTAYAAEKNGEFNLLGGGAVARKELALAQQQGVSPRVFNFEPDPTQLAAKLATGKTRETLLPIAQLFEAP
jgi:hypothetical protein